MKLHMIYVLNTPGKRKFKNPKESLKILQTIVLNLLLYSISRQQE